MTDPRSAVTPASRMKKVLSALGPALSVVMLCIAFWFLHRELAGMSRAAVMDYAHTIPLLTLLTGLACTMCSYLILTGYDAAALKYLGKDIPYARSAVTAFMAYAVGHNVGLAALSGGTIRYRMYTLAGLTATEIAQLITFVSLTFILGAAALLGLSLLLMPAAQTSMLPVSTLSLAVFGYGLLALPVVYLAATLLRRAPVKIGSWQFSLPTPGIAFSQVGLSIADLVFAASVLYVLLAQNLDIGFLAFLGIYLLAMAAGLISSVPGGIGVFEAVLVAAFPSADTVALVGTILVYRLIYYVLPLALAMLLLVAHESRQHGGILVNSKDKARAWVSAIAPQLVGTAVFLAGVVLLVSGASPAIDARIKLIGQGVPLALLELSHLTGSVIGVALLILARGLFRRLRSAYLAALAALAAGIVISVLKGLDYEEALLLGVIFIVLWISRDEFYRQGSVATQRYPPQWFGAIAIVLCIAIWVGFFSFRHVEYSNDLWWRFALNAEAPRMLRASVLAAVAALGFALWKVLTRVSNVPLRGDALDEEGHVRRILAGATDSTANVALLGDKRFFWSTDCQAFIMYQVSGESWIAMGDPVGPQASHEELVWAFREHVDRYSGRVIFYQVSDKSLALYVDLGLSLSKLGENARVPLDGFSLEGSRRADLRQARSKGIKNGAVFEVVTRDAVPGILTDLRRVSDNWLAEKSTSEKGFSIGSFSEHYIVKFDCAVVRVNQQIVAFANLWPAPAGGELSIDLMRYDQNAPRGIMDYLFIELMLWGKANGYRSFSLGMAPLSGMEQRALAPLWHKLGHLVFTQGESFYNFEGLRNYKDKFEPEWESRYLACPAGRLNLPIALLDVTSLISGGMTRILGK